MKVEQARRIPVAAARRIAEAYGYDQVAIVARKTGPSGLEWVTTYGRNKAHCRVAARIGEFLRDLARRAAANAR